MTFKEKLIQGLIGRLILAVIGFSLIALYAVLTGDRIF